MVLSARGLLFWTKIVYLHHCVTEVTIIHAIIMRKLSRKNYRKWNANHHDMQNTTGNLGFARFVISDWENPIFYWTLIPIPNFTIEQEEDYFPFDFQFCHLFSILSSRIFSIALENPILSRGEQQKIVKCVTVYNMSNICLLWKRAFQIWSNWIKNRYWKIQNRKSMDRTEKVKL